MNRLIDLGLPAGIDILLCGRKISKAYEVPRSIRLVLPLTPTYGVKFDGRGRLWGPFYLTGIHDHRDNR